MAAGGQGQGLKQLVCIFCKVAVSKGGDAASPVGLRIVWKGIAGQNDLLCAGAHGNDFIGGMVAAYAIKKVCETDAAHDFAVNATASVLDIKDSFEESIENIKEDAEDIHAEAQEKQQIEVFGPEDLIDDDEEVDVEFVKEE